MKLTKVSLLSLLFGLFLAFPAFAQVQSFADVNVEYTFDLPDDSWKMTQKPTAAGGRVQYVYNDRKDGHLEVRKLSLKGDELISDLIRNEEDSLQFERGYVAGKEERFAGNLKGTVFNYEFVQSGRAMSGRFYYLKADDSTVYVLRFTGERDKLRSIRNYTDSIARSFQVKKDK